MFYCFSELKKIKELANGELFSAPPMHSKEQLGADIASRYFTREVRDDEGNEVCYGRGDDGVLVIFLRDLIVATLKVCDWPA